jgi:hypothetical protein
MRECEYAFRGCDVRLQVRRGEKRREEKSLNAFDGDKKLGWQHTV